MADSYLPIIRYSGVGTGSVDFLQLGINDGDTLKRMNGTSILLEGDVESVKDEGGINYQNLSGFNAVAVLIIRAQSGGVATRHIKVFSSPTANTVSGTLLWETGLSDSAYFDSSSDRLTSPPMLIQNNHFLNVENFDDSRAGLNDLQVIGLGSSLDSLVVERSSV